MSLDRTNEIVGLSITICTLLGLIFAWLRWLRPRYRNARNKAVAISDALIGREAITDTITGRELAPALPGIGQRMETVERAVAHIADLLTTQHDQDQRLAALETRVDTLEAQAVERVAAKAEAVAAWQAVAAVAGQPESPAEPPLPGPGH